MAEKRRDRNPESDAPEQPDGGPQEGGAQDDGELRGTTEAGPPEMDVAVISGATFTHRAITYYNVDGIALFEGDIALGTVDDVRSRTEAAREALAHEGRVAFGVGITGSQFRWPSCRMPYEIDPNLPNQQRVTEAIAHWEANTAFRFPLRTAANAAQYPNWVRFTDSGGCWSFVGMQGGQQTISIGTGCSLGNTIHEIGHAVGLWHEQSREDRDLFVTIHWQNIQSGMAAQFNQRITDGDDWGTYDYGSIMHYPRTAFSANGQNTITPTDPNAQIGQRNGLSPGDIAAVQAMYPGCVVKQPVTDVPKKIIDEPFPFKKVRDDPRFKKISDDDLVLKHVRDPKLPRDPGPIKHALDPGPVKGGLDPIKGGRDPMPIGPEIVTQPGVITQPGTLQPFAIATRHHALRAAGMSDEQAAQDQATGYVTALQRQLLEIDAAIAQARSSAATASAEIARLEEAREQLAAAYAQAMQELGGSQ